MSPLKFSSTSRSSLRLSPAGGIHSHIEPERKVPSWARLLRAINRQLKVEPETAQAPPPGSAPDRLVPDQM
jgi:hypothetical protein